MNKFISLTDVTLRHSSPHRRIQRLLELLWTVYSERKLKSCLKLRNFQNPFNKVKSVGLQGTKTGLIFALVVGLAKITFTYMTVLK